MNFVNVINIFFVWSTYTKYIVLLTIIAIYCIYKKKYNKIPHFICFVGLAQITSIFIKASLRIPHPKYPQTFAFPSGHIFVVVSLVLITLWLLFKNKKIVIILTSILGAYECWRVVFLGYHTMFDAVSAYLMVFALFFAYKKIILPKVGLKNVLFFNFYAPYVMVVWFYKLCPMYMTKSAKELIAPTIISLATYIIIRILEKRKNFKVDNNID